LLASPVSFLRELEQLTTAFLLPWMKPGGPVDELEREEWNQVDVREGELGTSRIS
jgi:hypothetical protein